MTAHASEWTKGAVIDRAYSVPVPYLLQPLAFST